MPSAQDLGLKITTERQEFGKWMADHKATDGSFDLSGENLTEFNKRNDALGEMQKALAVQQAAEKAAGDNAEALKGTGTLAANKGDSADIEHKEVSGGIETKAQ